MFNLLQALYDPGLPLPHSSDLGFYRQAKEDIAYFGIASQVYSLLHMQRALTQTPSFFREWLEQSYTEALYLNLFIQQQTHRMLDSFEQQGIGAIPLKGVFFAERYFGHAGARATSDIDVLLRPSDLERAAACVRSLGFTSEEERIPYHFHWSFSKMLPHSSIPLTVELHWGLLKENTSNLNIERFWRQAKPWKHYRHIKMLSDDHTFYMMILHGWKHNLNSMKYFLDIVQLIHAAGSRLDYDALLKDATADQTRRRVVWTLTAVYRHFPHLNAIKTLPLQEKKNIHWDYQAVRSPNVKQIRHYIHLIYSQYCIFDSVKHAFPGIAGWLWPSKVEISFELADKDRKGGLWIQYVRLYAQRGYHVFQTVFRRQKKLKGTPTKVIDNQ